MKQDLPGLLFLMREKTRKRLLSIFVLALLFSLGLGLIIYSFRDNIMYFQTTSQILQQKTDDTKVFRLGGMVVEDTIIKSADSLKVRFVLTDYKSKVHVKYVGILPDLFREKQGVVVIGKYLGEGNFEADTVLAKHDENYMPRGIIE